MIFSAFGLIKLNKLSLAFISTLGRRLLSLSDLGIRVSCMFWQRGSLVPYSGPIEPLFHGSIRLGAWDVFEQVRVVGLFPFIPMPFFDNIYLLLG